MGDIKVKPIGFHISLPSFLKLLDTIYLFRSSDSHSIIIHHALLALGIDDPG